MSATINVKKLRESLQLSQSAFAKRYGVSLRTLMDWEQGRSSPDTAAQALLKVISHAPDTVVEALKTAS